MFSFATKAARDAYIVALDTRLGFPRVCPARLSAPGATRAQRTTTTAVESEDGSDGSWLCGVYPGEGVPVGAVRVKVERVDSTMEIASLTPVAEPLASELTAARTLKLERTRTVREAIDGER